MKIIRMKDASQDSSAASEEDFRCGYGYDMILFECYRSSKHARSRMLLPRTFSA